MTYQEKYEELHKEFAEKSSLHMKAFNELESTNGFGELNALPNFGSAKREFEVAGNDYHNFLCYVRDNKINPEDAFPEV